MSLFKSAQVLDAKDTPVDRDEEDQVILFDAPHEHADHDTVEMHAEPAPLSFDLGKLPGCNVEILEVSTDDPIEVSDEKEPESKKDLEVRDAWDVNDLRSEHIIPWMQSRFEALPRHNGESLGIERTLAYLKKFDRKLSDLIANDLEGKADIAVIESARTSIRDGIDKLEDARDEKEQARTKARRKRADEKAGLVKEAQKTTHVGGIIVTVPLLISSIARTCINSTVSAGKDIERTAHELIKKYELTDREQMELLQLISDMGFPLRRPRGYKLDEKIDPTSVDNNDWMANYYA
jgi:hypothetical protein